LDKQLDDLLGLLGLENSKYDWLLMLILLCVVLVTTYTTTQSIQSILYGVISGSLPAGLLFMFYRTRKKLYQRWTWFVGFPVIVVMAYLTPGNYRLVFICCSYIPVLAVSGIMRLWLIRNFNVDL
jgi:hypothetical protein